MTLARRPITRRPAPSAFPLNLFLPLALSPITTSPAHPPTHTLVWSSLRSHVPRFRPAPLALGSPLITLLSTLRSPPCRPRSSSRRSTVLVQHPIDQDTLRRLIWHPFCSSLLLCIFIPRRAQLCVSPFVFILSSWARWLPGALPLGCL